MNTAGTNVLEGEEIMTDLQFKAILKLVRQILKRSNDINDARAAIDEVLNDAEKSMDEKK